MNTIVKTKLRAIGNSTGIVLSKDILKDMSVSQGDELFLVKTEDGYKLTPYDAKFEKQMRIAEEGMKKYRNALRELAK